MAQIFFYYNHHYCKTHRSHILCPPSHYLTLDRERLMVTCMEEKVGDCMGLLDHFKLQYCGLMTLFPYASVLNLYLPSESGTYS